MTIYDIARKAGVSIATVSRVLNGGNVKEETRNKVQQVLDTCDYHPSQVAQGLANRQTRRVAVMTLDIRDVHHAAIAYEIERAMADAGYSTVLCNLGSDTTCVENALRGLRGQQFDGVFFIGSVFAMPVYSRCITRYITDIPILLTNAVLPQSNVYGVLADEAGAFCKAAKKLYHAGRRDIAFVMDGETRSERSKLDGYARAMAQCGLQLSIFRAERSVEGGRLAMEHILLEAPDTDAVLFTEDTTAVGGLQALHSRGITVPDRMAVIGCNNSVYCSICSPQLSSIDNSLHATGRTAARQMIALLNHEPDVEKSIRKKFRKSIWCKFTKAVREYELVKEGDCIAVCISGGKDSMLMAKLFQELKRHNKFPFEVKFLVMDPGYSPENRQIIEQNAKRLNIPITIFESDIFDAVFEIEKSPCYLCARMRRGHLYSKAKELGCNKIALGHHYDDVIETILMGMLYGAQVQTMMPKLHSTNFEGMELIRPLYLIREDDIKAWRDYNDLHFIQCACKFTDTCTTCNNNENRSKRVEIKELIKTLKQVNPFVESNIFRSVENVNLSTVVAYKKDGVKHHFLDTYDDVVQTENEPGMQNGAEIQMQSEETR